MQKSILLLSPVLLLGALSACVAIAPSYRVSPQQANSASVSDPAPTPTPISDFPSPRSVEVGEFTFKELSAVGDGGCGMSLWKPTRERVPKKFVLFNGLSDGTMWMKIDGKLVRFQRIAASGEEFYGQTIAQTFQNEDKTLRVEVSVELGEKGEIESIAISSATIRLERAGEVVELSPVGDAGC